MQARRSVFCDVTVKITIFITVDRLLQLFIKRPPSGHSDLQLRNMAAKWTQRISYRAGVSGYLRINPSSSHFSITQKMLPHSRILNARVSLQCSLIATHGRPNERQLFNTCMAVACTRTQTRALNFCHRRNGELRAQNTFSIL